MKAMILAAGRGTRLAPLTDTTPKPMLPLANKPLIGWQVEALVRAGVSEIVINLHHLGAQIQTYLEDGGRYGVHIKYSWETELLETGGAIVNALDLLEHKPFWLLNGDIWTDFDFAKLPSKPDEPDLAHLVLTGTPAYRSRGDFAYDNGRVISRGNDYVYCGIAALAPELFREREPEHFSLRDLYFELITQGRISAQIHAGDWHDIGTLAQYEALRQDFK